MSNATQPKLTPAQKLAKWGPGPWVDEPDHVAFEHAGVPCIVHRNDMGAWCGYAAAPPGHPWHGKSSTGTMEGDEYVESPIDASVHGGLTYGNACQGDICHVPTPGEPDDVHWLGFDCGHSGDLIPSMQHDFETYRDLAYVRRETEKLAEQIAAAGR